MVQQSKLTTGVKRIRAVINEALAAAMDDANSDVLFEGDLRWLGLIS